uniref:Scm like with four mbt domains 2 n=1 Tax=Sphenodon punctatus TaxID=8508 RepID=A0A8D0G6W2_SPHPU
RNVKRLGARRASSGREFHSSSIEDVDFNWDEYLEETGASTAPHTSFKHVEISLQSSFQPGMKLEVANKNNPDTYWVATIITTCGQLLLLRYCGYGDDRRADFWCDVMTADLHPVGWCTQNDKVLMPPDAIKEKYKDWTEFLIQDLTGSRTAPANLLEGPLRGKNPVDLITVDSLIELQDSQSPFQYWIVSVVENVGGRLRLRYVGLEETESYDQWLFYLDCRLRPVGWSPLWLPWKTDHADLRNHFFTVGMKLEAVDMSEPFNICPASVTKVFNNHYVQVTIDDLRPEPINISTLCHADTLGLLPVQWCLKNGVNLAPPKGWYLLLDHCDSLPRCNVSLLATGLFQTSFSRGFTRNMKLEAVNPRNPAEICVASITAVKGRLMWLRLEGLQLPAPEYIVDVESMDIFPVVWCEANAYSLRPPHKAVLQKKRKIAVVTPEKPYCCPPLFINHRCFSGPHLNKGRLAELPQSVGPGKCVLVLKEVLSMVINAAYKPGSVLRELQLVEDPCWNFQEETLKAKYRGKTYRATVKIVRTSDQVPDFCRRVCAKLECCPNLFSPVPITEACPENCSIHTKTKYTYYYGKRRKIIKPTVGVNNSLESRHVKPMRRRKRRKSIFVQRKRRLSTVDSNKLNHQPPQPANISGLSLVFFTSIFWLLQEMKLEEEDKLVLESNPLEWTVTDVVRFIKLTDCAPLAKIFQEQDIDGQALLLLTLPTVQECMELKLGPAIKLCHQIERVKVAFYAQYAN